MGMILQNCEAMIRAMDAAISIQRVNHDPECSPVTVSERIHTGKRGHPAVDIDPIALQQLLELRGPVDTAKFIGCSTCTVQQQALDLGLAQPGAAVFTYETQPDGSVAKVFCHRESTHSTNEVVHAAVSTVLEVYPNLGREKMISAVKAQGVLATRRQVEAALLVLRGPLDSRYRKPINRRTYTVPGSNYLWHHDGQHGLSSVQYHALPLI